MEERFDLIVKNGQVVSDSGVKKLDVGVLDGKIRALESSLPQNATQVINA
ncbi:allantoinase, partial [candidate division KSB1 bacterium]|nr:allantoinase [candidate division KSB1 bacterium]NIR69407.1 allantoinase [candidate division KSB1 bacterium]NIS24205.1 allantoinase [candidate division KSB1 bacterium]NIT71119.1 allantoinase [candidate division KSB1 bacterium]NIU24824.1 allantoinase [candidate division KSB1 bacterium]